MELLSVIRRWHYRDHADRHRGPKAHLRPCLPYISQINTVSIAGIKLGRL